MKKPIFLTIVLWCMGFFSYAQQFRISEYDGDSVTIEYPPSFDGAYLFIEQSSNLTESVWETVDYTQVNLVEGAPVVYSAPAEPIADGASSGETADVPYIITTEYITAVQNGEIENDSWSASSVWNATKNGVSGFFRIAALSFVDSDGDGVDNVTEYGNGTDPFTNDVPAVDLPVDDGDPRPVSGSVNSAPGDWNTPPLAAYRDSGAAWQTINALILALDGTSGTFTAESTAAELGGWIEGKCNGAWTAPSSGYLFPTVSAGSFYRMETAEFQWTGKEKIYPIALHAHDGTEQFVNHLIQADASDPVGLARLATGAPVLVDGGNPWTEEKLQACLTQLKTVQCRLQKVVDGAFDSSDLTYMAKGWSGYGTSLTPKDTLDLPKNIYEGHYYFHRQLIPLSY